MDWQPELYGRFEAERTRPAADLLAHVPLAAAGLVVDLGCGAGNSTELLADRFPSAAILGVDSSPAMIEAARSRLPECVFELADIATWQPDAAPELIFANAALQWVRDHPVLMPRLLSLLPPGGVLAVQMPDNLEAPSHQAMRAAWHDLGLSDAPQRDGLLPVERYLELLSPGARTDVWRTVYYHPMPSIQAIIDWLRATGLRPFLAALDAEAGARFLAAYARRLDAAIPRLPRGGRLLAFPRLFLIAHKRD